MTDNPPQTLQLDQPVSLPTPQSATPAPTQSSGAPPQTLQLDEPVNSSTSRQPIQGEDASGILGLGVGVAKGAMDTVQGGEALINHLLPANHQIPIINKESTGSENASQSVGKFAENAGEWATGLEGLEGFSKAAKFAELAEKIPGAANLMKLMDKYPFLAKMAEGTVKGAVVGGAQGAVKGAADGKAKEGAVGGAVGGAAGEGVLTPVIEDAVTPLMEAVADKFGIGTSSKAEAVRGARPAKRNVRFAEDFQRAAPYMDAVNDSVPAQTVEEWADNTKTAREKLYQTQIQPLVDRHATEPLGGINIANGIRNAIPNTMKIFEPQEAAKMEELANQFLPGQVYNLQMKDAEDALQQFNSKLTLADFYKENPDKRAAILRNNGAIAGAKAAADSIRDEFYGRLNQLEPNSNIAGLKKDYGALRNVENEIRGRVNVDGRQSPVNLKETIGGIMGLATGGVGGAAVAALPFADRIINSPANMISRGVQKAARPGEEGIVSKAVIGAGKGAKRVSDKTAGAAGAGIGTEVKTSGEPKTSSEEIGPGRIVFTASDGSTHSIPNDEQALAHARAVDPTLKIVA